jgi:putative effector of murein hydrolase LrgA (UPF0299 family)
MRIFGINIYVLSCFPAGYLPDLYRAAQITPVIGFFQITFLPGFEYINFNQEVNVNCDVLQEHLNILFVPVTPSSL